MMALLCMWFGISMPLVYLGYYFGFRKQPYDNPVRTNQIPRQVPEQRWYMNKFVGWVLFRSSNLLCASYWDCWWLQCSNWTLELMQAVFITYMFYFHQNPDGWNPTIWCHVHRTLLHFQCKPNCSALNASWSMQSQINSSSPVCSSVKIEYLKIVHQWHLKRNHWCEFSDLILLCTVMSTSLCFTTCRPSGRISSITSSASCFWSSLSWWSPALRSVLSWFISSSVQRWVHLIVQTTIHHFLLFAWQT